MKNTRIAILLVGSFFWGYSAAMGAEPTLTAEPTLSAEPTLACDSLCWPKGSDAPRYELQGLYCHKIFRTDTEGAYWRDRFNNGDLAVGKVATVRSSDAPPPSNAYCPTSSTSTSGDNRFVRVTGFAYQAKICGVNHPDEWITDRLLVIFVCGLTNNGKAVNFFPSPQQTPTGYQFH